MLEVQELSGKELEAYHIGFILGPCFNAAGRIDTVTRAFELLEETNKEKALQMARQLKDINDTRKQMTEEAAKCAFEILQESGKEDEPVHIVLLPDCHESLVGIVAGRIPSPRNRVLSCRRRACKRFRAFHRVLSYV